MRRTSCPSVEISSRSDSGGERQPTKCARPHKADERIGNDRSIKMICEFISAARLTRRGSYAFFDRRIFGGL